MSLVAFAEEEQVEAFGETLTLRLDFKVITTVEAAFNYTQFPVIVGYLRSLKPPLSMLGETLWAMLRYHHPEITRDQVLSMLQFKGPDGLRVGFALDALLERSFPPEREGKKPKNVRSGQSKSSAVSG